MIVGYLVPRNSCMPLTTNQAMPTPCGVPKSCLPSTVLVLNTLPGHGMARAPGVSTPITCSIMNLVFTLVTVSRKMYRRLPASIPAVAALSAHMAQTTSAQLFIGGIIVAISAAVGGGMLFPAQYFGLTLYLALIALAAVLIMLPKYPPSGG